jgi:hypothetical protein
LAERARTTKGAFLNAFRYYWIVRATFTVSGVPADGVMITVALYVPAIKPATFTLKVIGVACPGVSLPVVGETTNQGCDGLPAVHVKVFPP